MLITLLKNLSHHRGVARTSVGKLPLLARTAVACALISWGAMGSVGVHAQSSAVQMGGTQTGGAMGATLGAAAAMPFGLVQNAQAAQPGVGNGTAAPVPVQRAQGNLAAREAAGQRTAEDDLGADPRRVPKKPAEPNQFQRFVQESTGRMLPIFGEEFFDASAAYGANNAVPPPQDYVLSAGDEVVLQVWGPFDYSANLVIDRNGQVNIPKVGVLTLAGVPVRNLDATIKAHLGRVFSNFQSSASMGRLRGIQVYVVGQARQPGTLQISSVSSLVNALFASGGPNANGSMRNIELKRGGKTITTIDLYDFIAKGDKSRDVPLLSGDVIVIPPVGPRVAVTGALDQAAIYELKPGGSSVAEVLALSGGVPSLAASQKALVERINPKSTPPRQVQELVLNDQGLRQALQDGDILTLLGISPAFANAVTLQGNVAAPLRYRWFEGMRVLDLIPERDALITSDYYRRKNLLVQNTDAAKTAGTGIEERMRTQVDQINWEYAVIERLDRSKLAAELIPFNLGKAVLDKDPAHNLPLQPGDVITILAEKDLRLPQEKQARLVRVEGEVVAPGVYKALPGETVPQLLRRIGGLTPQAYVFGTELNRESVKQYQQQNLDALTRRLEAQLQSQAGASASNRGLQSLAEAQAVQQQQQAQLASQITRLRSLKSSGRMALELEPSSQSLAGLPPVPLESGDRIYVPPEPSFVAAFGAVNNENVFIHKRGRTVADVMRSAGLTDDAEVDQAFVLRADGSVVSRRDRSGVFGGGFESISLMPGDTLVVPAKVDRESRYNFITRTFKDWTQILANFGLGVAAIKSIN